MRQSLLRLLLREDLNFLLTNRIPRRFATRAVGRIARIEHPLIARPAIAIWRFFCDVDLSDAETDRFASLREAFIRKLRPGARVFDPDSNILASPCDAIVGAHGRVERGRAYQVKGMDYELSELIGDAELAERYAGGWFVTLRLTAAMYHRFHAPADISVAAVRYLSGDCWNVNPIALKRVERLFCRNERAVIEARAGKMDFLLVPVAAILVAGIRLTFLDTERLLREQGAGRTPCNAQLTRGAEMGWFEHGSTIIVLLPPETRLHESLAEGSPIRAGEPLGRLPGWEDW